MRVRNSATVFFYLAYAFLSAAGLYVSRFFIGPYIAMHYVFPMMPTDTNLAKFFVIAMFGISDAVPAGFTFGAAIGLWGVSQARNKAFWLSLSAPTLLIVYYALTIPWDVLFQHQMDMWVRLIEAVAFIGVFVLAAIGTSRLAQSVDATLRKSGSVFIVVFFFIVAALMGP